MLDIKSHEVIFQKRYRWNNHYENRSINFLFNLQTIKSFIVCQKRGLEDATTYEQRKDNGKHT